MAGHGLTQVTLLKTFITDFTLYPKENRKCFFSQSQPLRVRISPFNYIKKANLFRAGRYHTLISMVIVFFMGFALESSYDINSALCLVPLLVSIRDFFSTRQFFFAKSKRINLKIKHE